MVVQRYMSDMEIVSSYREAKDRRMQIGILADLNVCEPEEIANILQAQGIDLSIPQQKPTKKAPIKRFHWTIELEQWAFWLYEHGVPVRQIADQIGAARPTVNRKMAMMKRDKAVRAQPSHVMDETFSRLLKAGYPVRIVRQEGTLFSIVYRDESGKSWQISLLGDEAREMEGKHDTSL